MNWIDSHRHVDESVTVGNGRMNLRTNRYCMRGSSQQGLQHAFYRFLLRATKQERTSALKRLRYCVFQDAQGSVFCTRAKIHCGRWRRSSSLGWYSRVTKVGTMGLIHELVKLTQFCTGTDPAGKFRRRGDFSNIWHSNLITT